MNKKDKIFLLDLSLPIKFVAFSCVFLLHSIVFAFEGWNEKPIASLVTTPAWGGVWIFFILSGYGIMYGYTNHKYDATCSGILKFYFLRYIKVAPIYYLYLLIAVPLFAGELFTPTFSFGGIWRLLTFNYAEEFNLLYFGATWFLSTLMKLYMMSPLIYWLTEKLQLRSSKKRTVLCIIVVLSFGLIMRLLGFYSVNSGISEAWTHSVYKPFYMNLDLYISGFLAAYIHKFNEHKQSRKSVIFFWILLLFIGVNSGLIYISLYSIAPIEQSVKDFGLFLCQYIFPTVYAMIVVFVMSNKHVISLPICFITKILNAILTFYKKGSLQIYLVHSNVFLLFYLITQRWFEAPAMSKPFTALVILIGLSVPATVIVTELFCRISNFLFSGLQRRCKDISFTICVDKGGCEDSRKPIEEATQPKQFLN